MTTLFVRGGKVVVPGYDELAQSVRDEVERVLREADVRPTFVEASTLVAPDFLAPRLGRCLKPKRRDDLVLDRARAKGRVREYTEPLDPEAICESAHALADHVEESRAALTRVLTTYETHAVARDEIARTVDLLRNLHQNRPYFSRRIGDVATFLPSNQPLYSLSCFGVVPAWMATTVHVRPASTMRRFFAELLEVLDLKRRLPNVVARFDGRAEFIAERAKRTDAVIFTGTPRNAAVVRRQFDADVLFIVNGSGHNPVVITETANVERAVESVVRVQLHNQGQDCASPNSVLVHRLVYDAVVARLHEGLARIRVGDYGDPDVIVGPVTRRRDLLRIQRTLVDNARYLDPRTPGTIHTARSIVEPTIIHRPLADGGNYAEHFAPILFLQRYDADADVARYFDDPRYALHAMYVTVHGKSEAVDALVQRTVAGRPLHDESTILRDTDLHAPWVERGIQPYGGYGAGASYVRIHGRTIAKPTLPQRDFHEHLVLPTQTGGSVQDAPGESEDRRPVGRFLDPSIAPVHDGDSSTMPLVDGAEYFGEAISAIRGTRGPGDAIYLLAFQLDPRWVVPTSNQPLGSLLADKAAAGVDVRIVLNGTRTPINPWRENEAAAAALRAHRSLAHRVLVETEGLRLLGSQHQKVLLVHAGGELRAFASGMDFVPDHFDRVHHDERCWPDGSTWGWHDVGVLVRGAATSAIWDTFVDRWTRAERGVARLPLIPTSPARAVLSKEAVQVLRSCVSRGEPPIRELHAAYARAIAAAERYVYIEDQFLCDQGAEHLGLRLPASAPAAGLSETSLFANLAARMIERPGLKLILVGSGKSDPIDFLPGPRNVRLTRSLRRLVDSLPPSRRENVAVHRVEGVTVHSKVMLVDDVYAAIGSANFRTRSFFGVDNELQVATVAPAAVQRLRARLWAEHFGLRPIEELLIADLDRALAYWKSAWSREGVVPARSTTRLVPLL